METIASFKASRGNELLDFSLNVEVVGQDVAGEITVAGKPGAKMRFRVNIPSGAITFDAVKVAALTPLHACLIARGLKGLIVPVIDCLKKAKTPR